MCLTSNACSHACHGAHPRVLHRGNAGPQFTANDCGRLDHEIQNARGEGIGGTRMMRGRELQAQDRQRTGTTLQDTPVRLAPVMKRAGARSTRNSHHKRKKANKMKRKLLMVELQCGRGNAAAGKRMKPLLFCIRGQVPL